jgi:hypothetical protein
MLLHKSNGFRHLDGNGRIDKLARELEYIFFCRAKRENIFQNVALGYMTKTLNQIIIFSSTKIRIFFSATLGIRIFKFNGRSLKLIATRYYKVKTNHIFIFFIKRS